MEITINVFVFLMGLATGIVIAVIGMFLAMWRLNKKPYKTVP